MKLYQALLLGTFVCFATPAATATWAPAPTGGTINCWNSAEVETGHIIWSYVIKTSQSRRIASDIYFFDGSQGAIYSNLNVAQYEDSDQKVSLLVDDINETLLFYFEAKNPPAPGKPFNADLQQWAGGETNQRKLKCIIAL